MERVFSFAEVIARAKECFGVAKDNELAALLGMSPQTLNNRKKTESLPYEELLALAISRQADMQYILTGFRSGEIRETPKSCGVGEDQPIPPRKQAMMDLFDGLDEEGQREIQDAIEKEKRRAEARRRLAELERQAKTGAA